MIINVLFMFETLQKFFEEKFEKLPEETRQAIKSVDWIKATKEIADAHLLDETGTAFLQVETMLVLAGLVYGEVYTTNIENHVGVTREEANKIADEADEKIFTPIYNTMQENISKGLQNKKIKPEDNLNFVLSGGDYSVFLPQSEENANRPDTNLETRKISGYTPAAGSKVDDLKNDFLYREEEKNKTNKNI